MSVSQLLLFEELEFHSTLSVEEIKSAIEQNTDTGSSFYKSLFQPSSKKYIGKIGTDSFTIWRNTTIRNLFRPLIKGKLFVQNDLVRCRIRLHISSIHLILLLPSFAFAVMLSIAIADYGEITLIILPLLLMLPFYIWAVLSLKAESGNVKSFLSEVIKISEYKN
ncbi:hypothetical protein [Pollutibacter soli]|uniref:hypothetical protein n=1 Tax=Pollutibacter soli TaxID=3034157 RepID=UPI003013E057